MLDRNFNNLGIYASKETPAQRVGRHHNHLGGEAYTWHFVGGIDVILGVVWLETSGTITMDWKAMFMKFVHEGKPVQL